jgi:hypothetical protein
MDYWFTFALTTISAVLAALIVQGLFFRIVQATETRKRRREIVILLAQCADRIFDSVRNGELARKWADPKDSEFDAVKREYWKVGTRALSLFEVREHVVAKWVEVELHAGLVAFFYLLRENGTPKTRVAAQTMLEGFLSDGPDSEEVFDYGPPRPSMLAEWAELRSSGPIYGSLETPGDKSRQHIVIPNSDIEIPERLSPIHGLSPRGHRLLGRWSEKRRARYYRHLEQQSSREWQRKARDSALNRLWTTLSRLRG